MVATRPGMRSFLPCRLGTQKLWITSLEVSVRATINGDSVKLTDTSGALAPTTARERYYNHQNPMEETDKIIEEQLIQTAASLLNLMLAQKMQGLVAQEGAMTPEQLLQAAQEIPATAQQSLVSTMEGPGNEGRAATASGRAGRGQRMSELSGNNLGTEVPIA